MHDTAYCKLHAQQYRMGKLNVCDCAENYPTARGNKLLLPFRKAAKSLDLILVTLARYCQIPSSHAQ